jgi:hypothetical protein
MEGLNISGLSSNFGKISVFILLAVGLLLVLSTHSVSKSSLKMATVKVLNNPYQPGYENKKQEMILVPIEQDKKILVIEDFALKAGGMDHLLKNIRKDDVLTIWLDDQNAALLQEKDGGNRVKVSMLSKGNESLVSEQQYNKALGNNGQMGWWVLALGLSMVPYFFISNPRINPGWVFMAILAAMIAWLIFT